MAKARAANVATVNSPSTIVKREFLTVLQIAALAQIR